MSDKWGILPILSSYPSFNNILDRKVETCKEQFSQNYRKFFKTVGKKYYIWGKDHCIIESGNLSSEGIKKRKKQIERIPTTY